MRDFKIRRAPARGSTWNHKYDFKTAWHEVQLPLYYSHFEITEFSQYQNLFDQVSGSLKKEISENKKAFTSHFVPETEIMQHIAKIVVFKTKMMWFGTQTMRFTCRTDVI